MSKKPIEIFKSEEQFKDCCKYWQHILFLDNWFIRFEMVDEPINLDGDILYGVCEFNYLNKEAVIRIFNGRFDADDSRIVCKECAELTVIHELLHLREEYISEIDIGCSDTRTFHEYMFHQGIETMAKTLLMTRYSLGYDYFFRGVTS